MCPVRLSRRIMKVSMTLLLAAIPGHVLDDAKRPLFVLLCGFIVTFLVARLNTRLARAHGGSGPAPRQHRHARRPAHPPRRVRHHRHGRRRHPRVRRAAGQPVGRDARLRLRRRRGAHARRVRPRPPPRGRVLDRRGPQEHRRHHPRRHVHHAAAHRPAAAHVQRARRLHHALALGRCPRSSCAARSSSSSATSRASCSSAPSASSCRRWRSSARSASPSRGRRGRAGSTPTTRPRWSARGAATRASTRCGSGASTPVGRHRRQAAPLAAAPRRASPRPRARPEGRVPPVARLRARGLRAPSAAGRYSSCRRAVPRGHGRPATGRPPRGRHAMLDEALDLVDAARADGVDVRLVGGLAVLTLCAGPEQCRRDHRDVDLVAPRRQAGRLLATLDAARLRGEPPRAPRQQRRAAAGVPPVPPPGRARGPLHPDDRVDVYLDAFRLHHTLPLRRRLRREAYTLPPSDVLLAKLLRTRMSADRRAGRRHTAAGRAAARRGGRRRDRPAVPRPHLRAGLGAVPRRHRQPGARRGGGGRARPRRAAEPQRVESRGGAGARGAGRGAQGPALAAARRSSASGCRGTTPWTRTTGSASGCGSSPARPRSATHPGGG